MNRPNFTSENNLQGILLCPDAGSSSESLTKLEDWGDGTGSLESKDLTTVSESVTPCSNRATPRSMLSRQSMDFIFEMSGTEVEGRDQVCTPATKLMSLHVTAKVKKKIPFPFLYLLAGCIIIVIITIVIIVIITIIIIVIISFKDQFLMTSSYLAAYRGTDIFFRIGLNG